MARPGRTLGKPAINAQVPAEQRSDLTDQHHQLSSPLFFDGLSMGQSTNHGFSMDFRWFF